MSNGRIFLIGQTENDWIPMVETPYDQEEILQHALAQYPDLLPGDQINPESPRRWLLVKRELGVPGMANGGGIWSLDHLFLDQDGIPTFVECKRAGDTRSRREVVAQMLDYAANGTEYWPMDRLRQAATETASSRNLDIDSQIENLLGLDGEEAQEEEEHIETFWKEVETNLRQGRIRLLFVADAIPRELRRLVEFLNDKMTDVQVLAVEVKQFLGHGQTAMVPRIIGLTEKSREKKPGRTSPIYTRATFLNDCLPEAVPFVTYVLDKTDEEGHTIRWRQSCFVARLFSLQDGREVSFAYVYPAGELQFYTGYLQRDFPKINLGELWRALLDTKLFHNNAEHTLSAKISAENQVQLRQAYDLILYHMKKLTNHTEQETES
ncbi:MAG: hypothetical protein R6X32_13520 [Chloroflexota bacterium]